MSTTIRSELSKKNPYWIERHRYYELKHFCMQYPGWKRLLRAIDSLPTHASGMIFHKGDEFSDPTGKAVELRDLYKRRIEMIENTAQQTDSIVGMGILQGVTMGVSYDILKTRIDIPCCKEVYYGLYRKFFWLLDKTRQ